MRLKPSCSFCKDHAKFAENTQLRILLQSYRGLCQYINSTGIPNKWGSMPVSCGTNINSSSSIASTVLTSSHGVGALLTGPTNFYQLIEEGANLKDRYSFFSLANATTAAINNKESVKENNGTNGSVQGVTPSSTASTSGKTNGSSTASPANTKKSVGKNNNFSSVVNKSSSVAKVASASGNSTIAKVANGINGPEKSSKTSPAARRIHPYSAQVQKTKAGNSSQLNQQAANTSANKLPNQPPSAQTDTTFSVKGVIAQASGVANSNNMSNSSNSNATTAIVTPTAQIIPDPTGKTGKLLRIPAALSISAIKTSSATTLHQTSSTPSIVLAKKGTTLPEKVFKKSDNENRISLSVLPSGQFAIATSNVSALRNGTSITVPTSSVKILTNSDALPVQQKTASLSSSTTLPLGFTCVAIDSSGNQVASTLDQATVLMTPAKIQVNQMAQSINTNPTTTPQTSQLIAAQSSALKSKPGRRGCRCGLATPNPGKLTCCGQRCPCYVDGKGCYDCKCRGCRNPRKTNSKSTTTATITPAAKTQSPTVIGTSSSTEQLLSSSSANASSNVSSVQQLISIPSGLTLNTASPSTSASRANNLFLSSSLTLGSPMPVSNGLTLVSAGGSSTTANDPLTLPLLEEDSLTTTTVDDDKLPYSMIISDD